jgi:hypothetical protein
MGVLLTHRQRTSKEETKMFISPLTGSAVELNKIAQTIGCKVGEIEGNNEFPRFRVALAGNTYPIKDQLKAAGFRFDGVNKVWFVAGYDQMAAFLETL